MPAKGLFYKIIGDLTGMTIGDDGALMSTLVGLSEVKRNMTRLKARLLQSMKQDTA